MAVTSTPVFVQTPKNGLAQISTGTGSSVAVTVYTGGTNGTKITGLNATGYGSTNAYDVQWGITSSSVFYGIGTVAVSANAGSTSGVASANLLYNILVQGLAIDSDGNPYVILKSSLDALTIKSPATSSTWTTGAVINVVATCGDF